MESYPIHKLFGLHDMFLVWYYINVAERETEKPKELQQDRYHPERENTMTVLTTSTTFTAVLESRIVEGNRSRVEYNPSIDLWEVLKEQATYFTASILNRNTEGMLTVKFDFFTDVLGGDRFECEDGKEREISGILRIDAKNTNAKIIDLIAALYLTADLTINDNDGVYSFSMTEATDNF